MAFQFIKKLFTTGNSSSTIGYSQVANEFHSLLQDVFPGELLGYIQPESFEEGVLIVRCTNDYMLELNHRKAYFIGKLNEQLGGSCIVDVKFMLS